MNLLKHIAPLNKKFCCTLYAAIVAGVAAAGGQAFQIDKPALSIDSLKNALPLLSGKARVDCLNELVRSYNEAMLPAYSDSALKYVSAAYKEASSLDYTKGLGEACRQYANIYCWRPSIMNTGNTDCKAESEKYYRQAIGWYEKIGDNNGLGFCYYGLANILWVQDTGIDASKKNYDLSLKYFQKAANKIMEAELIDLSSIYYFLHDDVEKSFDRITKAFELRKQMNDYRGMTFSYYRLGLAYQFADDMEASLEYYKKTLELATEQSVKWNDIYMHIGNVYLWTNRLDSAEFYFKKLLSITPGYARAQAAYGQLNMQRGDYQMGIAYLQPAATYFKKHNDWQAAWALIDLAKCYAGLKQYSTAFRYGRECSAEVDKGKFRDALIYVYGMYADIYEKLNQQDSSNWYFRKQITLRDSLQETESLKKQKRQMAMYKVAAREELQQSRIDLLNRDNQIKQQQLQKEALLKKLLIVSLAVFLLLAVVIIRNISLKRRNDKHRLELAENELQISELENERTRSELKRRASELEMQALRSQMNPHFIFNSLNSINRFILQSDKKQASEYLTKFSRLIRLILQNSQSAMIPLESELESLQLYLELEAVRFDHHFEYSLNVDDELDMSNIKVPPLIIQPYAENAIWHGLMHKEEKGHLRVELFEADALLCCIITDNGIGRKKADELKSKSASVHKSMGMRITADRISILQQSKQQVEHIKITDLVLPDGAVGGTKVVLKIPLVYD